jgi:hypothetical protein
MSEVSPPKSEEKGQRSVALGAMRRVFKSRQQARENRISVLRHQEGEREVGSGSESEDEDANLVTPLTQNTSNHYTLNMPSSSAPQSDLPYILLGQVTSYTPY